MIAEDPVRGDVFSDAAGVEDIRAAFERLDRYIRHEGFAGWDPFDGLNSRLFQATPLRHWPLARLALLQACKRSPINFRPLLGVPKGKNNKGLGLVLSALVRAERAGLADDARELCNGFLDFLDARQARGFSGACWGYNFDWQSRAFFIPKLQPTVVATTFVANGLLDMDEAWGVPRAFDLARSACEFILRDLHRHFEGDALCFSYSPHDYSRVYNASLLGARLLARVGAKTNDREMVELAAAAVLFAISRQRPDGAWAYGDLPFHAWVDSFHTGFNLDCLDDYRRLTGDETPNAAIDKGFAYFRDHFFEDDGAPRYYDTATYPIDGHTPAQAILTLLRFGDRDQALKVARWTIHHMQSPSGYFYYQKRRGYTVRIAYMRWVQQWLYFALAELLDKTSTPGKCATPV
jgi:hypothetical protein